LTPAAESTDPSCRAKARHPCLLDVHAEEERRGFRAFARNDGVFDDESLLVPAGMTPGADRGTTNAAACDESLRRGARLLADVDALRRPIEVAARSQSRPANRAGRPSHFFSCFVFLGKLSSASIGFGCFTPSDREDTMFRWLPTSLQRLYRRLIDARPYARKTRPRPLPPENEAPACGRDRHYRLEIAYDAFCEHCPPPRTLFRADPARRDLTSWCERMTRWTQRRRPRCHHCERARSLYLAARDTGDWKAEVALYKLARRGAVRLLAERRQYREQRRQFWARHREHVARNGPEPMPPQFEPELWPMIAHRGSHESWHHRDRRAVERDLVRAHARHLRREIQRRSARLRDLHADESAGRKSAQRVPHGRDDADAASPPSPEPRHGEERERRSNPGQREKRLPRDQGSPRRRKPARDGDGRASGATEPPPAAPLRRRRRAGRGDSAMRGRPRDRVLQEAPDLDQRALVEIGPVAAGLEHVPPVAQVVQGDVHLGELLEAAGEHAVEEHHEGVVDDRAGVAQGLAELDLGLAVGGEVLDQQGPLALRDIALDQSIAPEALGLLTDIGHRRHHPVGDPGGEGDAGGLAAGHDPDLLPADLAADLLDAQLTDLRTSAREGDDSAAIHIDGRLPAGGEGVGLGGADVE